MSDFVICTESTSDLPRETAKKYDINMVPFSFTIDEKTYSDFSEEVNPKTFYNMLNNSKSASTSQVNSKEYETFFRKFLEEGKDILHISFSMGLSGAYCSAKVAQKKLLNEFPDRKITIIDSLCASLGFGLLVYSAAVKKNMGMQFEDLARWVLENRLRVCHIFTVADLRQLKKGGRISPAVAFFGGLLNIKPVLHVNREGKLEVFSKARGRQKSIQMMVDRMRKTLDNEREIKDVFISHADCEEDALFLKKLVVKNFGPVNVLIGNLGPVIGCHAGHGTLALFYFGSDRS